jgi:hypothetical protein
VQALVFALIGIFDNLISGLGCERVPLECGHERRHGGNESLHDRNNSNLSANRPASPGYRAKRVLRVRRAVIGNENSQGADIIPGAGTHDAHSAWGVMDKIEGYAAQE